MAKPIADQNDIECVEELHILSEDIGKLFENDSYSDITLNIEGTHIQAHKVILATRSNYFYSLFYGGFKESNSEAVDLSSDTPLDAFRIILRYIYTGRINCEAQSNDDLLDVLSLSHKYGLSALEKRIQEVIINSRLTSKNMLKFLAFNETYNYQKIYESCVTLIDSDPTTFLRSDDIPSLSASSFHSIIGRDTFNVHETQIFRAAKCWIDTNSSSCKEDQLLVLGTIRLHHIPRKYLMKEVRKTKLFSPDAILDALDDQYKRKLFDIRGFMGNAITAFDDKTYNEEEDKDYLTEESEESSSDSSSEESIFDTSDEANEIESVVQIGGSSQLKFKD